MTTTTTSAVRVCLPDAWWERIEPLLPPRKPHTLGCHRPRVDDPKAIEAIFFVLRTGCQWNAPESDGPLLQSCCPSPLPSVGGSRCLPGALEARLVATTTPCKGMDWEGLAMDGAMTKAPLGETGGQASDRSRPQANPVHPQGMVWTRATTSTRYGTGGPSSSVPPISGRGVRRRKPSSKLDTKRVWVVERTHRWMNRFRRVLIRWDKNWHLSRVAAFDVCLYRLQTIRPIGIGSWLTGQSLTHYATCLALGGGSYPG